MNIDVSILIAVLGFALSVGTFFVGRMTAAKTSGFEDGSTKADIRYIREAVDKHDKKLDRVAENYDAVKSEIAELWERLKLLEQRVDMLHKEDV